MRFGRRTFLGGAALLPRLARARPRWPPYARAMIIDALGAPGDPALREGAALPERDVRDAIDSGLTACNVTVTVAGSWSEADEDIAHAQAEVDRHPEAFLRVDTAGGLRAAKRSRRVGLVFGTQNLAMIGDDLSRLAALRDRGVRIVQLTYNRRNQLGDGSLEPTDAGVSTFGREAIARVNQLRLLLDLSHGGWRTIGDSVALSARPCAITHTGCADVVAHPRNVPGRLLRALADRGGVAGIYFMPYLRERGQPVVDDVIRHLEHAVNVAGEDHVGIGTDGTISPLVVNAETRRLHREDVERRKKLGIGAPGEDPEVLNYIPELNTPRRLETLALLLSRRGHKDARIEKILGGNFARLFSDVWG